MSIGDESVEDFEFDAGEMVLSAAYDSLENLYFPRQGLFAAVSWTASRDAFGADSESDQYTLGLAGSKSWGRPHRI